MLSAEKIYSGHDCGRLKKYARVDPPFEGPSSPIFITFLPSPPWQGENQSKQHQTDRPSSVHGVLWRSRHQRHQTHQPNDVLMLNDVGWTRVKVMKPISAPSRCFNLSWKTMQFQNCWWSKIMWYNVYSCVVSLPLVVAHIQGLASLACSCSFLLVVVRGGC